MGSCFGSLLATEPTTAAACLWRHATDEQEAELMDEADEDEMNTKKQKFIFRIIKFRRKQKRKQFMKKFWQHHDANYSQLNSRIGNNESTSEIQLQNLDVNNLLTSNTLAAESVINAASAAAANAATAHFSSRTSSLDLEWEHEYGSHMRPYPLTMLPPTTKPLTQSFSSAAAAAVAMPAQRNAVDLGLDSSWQFLSQCRRYFDEESINSQHSSLAPPTATNMESIRERITAAESDQLRRLPGNSTQTKLWYSNSSCKLQQQNVLRPIACSSFTRTSSRNSCSHVSSCSSLEWDIDEEQQRQMDVEDDNLGLDTLELLHQIEQLKNKVLNETGDGLASFDAELFEEIDIS